ncbi:sulfite exporter TauE/SafE family protein [Hoeflea prorocentri]|uniref:Probable membrane transporter protein n=1 Tax=Hoeflea prorocentri TaxID=1922333 RepID=A0A9X3ZIN6_9HYPH|nr:sulfite exporter TauE/SafE family protein [Hoeflea prorocentri]MCY6383112.1 sulfite exporter TauE/SafE family protein [Hoeflea prorocentri]MDA5400912.1 sulfite exporter TauE/SafE family protein [Hoeflea prorocentri]
MEPLLHLLLPESLPVQFAALLIAASLVTSFITASVGIGGGAAMIALMSYLVPAAALIPVHGAVQLGSNAGRTFILRAHVDRVRIAAFAAGAVFGAAVGAVIAVRISSGFILVGLGLFIIASTWIPVRRMAAIKMRGFAAIGALTTFLGMFFGATGPINAALLSSSFADRQTLVGSLAALMSIQHGFKIVGFAAVGFAFAPWLPLIGLMIASGFIGTLAGSRLLHALPEKGFRLAFKIVLTVLSIGMIQRGVNIVY